MSKPRKKKRPPKRVPALALATAGDRPPLGGLR
jgi:hypothetical protein